VNEETETTTDGKPVDKKDENNNSQKKWCCSVKIFFKINEKSQSYL